MSWIFPCNELYFDIHGAFENMEYLDWDIHNINVEIGDYVYIYVSAPEKAIRFKCVVTDVSDYKKIDDSAYGGNPVGYRANQATIQFLEMYTEPGIELSVMKELGINKRFSMQSIIRMPQALEDYINQIGEAEDEPDDTPDSGNGDEEFLESVVDVMTPEGKKKAVYTTKYERKPANRAAAIAVHGTVCMACGFDFGKMYGEYGKGFIEVHHAKPLFENAGEIIPDPKTDLICLCSNCHRMVHRFRNKVLTLDELKSIIAEASD